MMTKLLALGLGVAMLGGVGLANASPTAVQSDTKTVLQSDIKNAAQSNLVRLTDKQMDAVTAGRSRGGTRLTTGTIWISFSN
jgi:hypothetical protein